MSIFEFDRQSHEQAIKEEQYAKGQTDGAFKTLYELVKDKLLSLGIAASKAGQSEEEFAAGMEAYFAQGGTAAL